jgi:excinuclease ABC subunit A
VEVPPDAYAALPGLTLHELACLPIARCRERFASLHLPAPLDQATELLFGEIRARLAKDQIHEIIRPRH